MNDGDPTESSTQLEPELPEQKPWTRRAQAVAAVIWPSFLAAAFGSMLFFAIFDPGLLEQAMTRPVNVHRMTGYALGFFFFWLITALASAISVYLMRTAHRDLRVDNVKD